MVALYEPLDALHRTEGGRLRYAKAAEMAGAA